MSDFESLARMMDAEADCETLRDIHTHIGQFATFIDMIQRGQHDEV